MSSPAVPIRRAGLLVLAGLVLLASSGFAAGFDRGNGRGNQVLVRATPEVAHSLAERHGLTLLASADAGGPLALLEGPAGLTAEGVASLLAGEPGVASVSPATLAALPGGGIELATADVAGDLLRGSPFVTPCLEGGFGGAVWSGFGDQAAAAQLRLHPAQAASAGCGAGVTVAILDTGVDPEHPLLAPALADGLDLLAPSDATSLVASEWGDLDQSIRTIVEQSIRTIVEESEIAVLDGQGTLVTLGAAMAPILAAESTTDLAALDLPTYFGHGTMVAGLVRWVAPAARILPVRVFGGDGTAHVFDIVRGIYWAVDQGADVINMSFSVDRFDKELLRAIEYAKARGVVCVAAAGNRGERTRVYPAAFGSGIGVAAVDDDDTISAYSNYGAELARLAAPGSGLVSTYPGGLYAAGWGTSFSTPLVSGALALARPAGAGRTVETFHRQVHALTAGAVRVQELSGSVAAGRLDVLGTVRAAQ